MSKFAALTLFAMKQELEGIVAMCLRVFLYYLVLYVFYLVFSAVTPDAKGFYYVCFTQMLQAAYVPTSFAIFADLQSDLFALRSVKPIAYILQHSIHSLATFAVRIAVLLVAYSLFINAVSIYHPPAGRLIDFALAAFLGSVIFNFITIIIGLLSYWTKDVKPLFYFNLTSSFCLGGLIMPLKDYPLMLKNIAYCTPYPWLLNFPAAAMSDKLFSYYGILAQLAWSIALGFISYGLFRYQQQSIFQS